MGSPFTTAISTPVLARRLGDELATHKQLQFVSTLMTERDWTKGQDSWVRRIAVINATLAIAEQVSHDPKMADQLKIQLFDRHDLHGTFHQLMDFSFASAVNDERDPSLNKPLTKKGASALIEHLRVQPTKAPMAVAGTPDGYVPSAEVVPAGRYAVETEDGATNGLAFYKVDRPTEGRWAGRVFVKLMVSDEEQRMSFTASKAILNKIAEAGAEVASARYGHEIGQCGVCGRTLTNDESRARGIGPVCIEKMGW